MTQPTPNDDQAPRPGEPGTPPAAHPPAPDPTPNNPTLASDAPAPGSDAPVALPPPPRKRRVGLIVAIATAAAVLLCGGGGTAAFLALRNTETGEGAANPTGAVIGFLNAVYIDQSGAKAAKLVCSAARDRKALDKRVAEVKKLSETYDNPRFTWSPPTLTSQTAERAVVSTQVTMATADEKVAHQPLTFTLVEKNGWRVCEVS